MLIPLGVLAVAGAGSGAATGAFEFISNSTLGVPTASIVFSSIPTDYKHLQLRITGYAETGQATARDLKMTFNGTNTWGRHRLSAEGAGAAPSGSGATSQTFLEMRQAQGYSGTGGHPAATIVDIYDYQNLNRATSVSGMVFSKTSTVEALHYFSGVYIDTDIVNSITFTSSSTNIGALTSISLYGIRG